MGAVARATSPKHSKRKLDWRCTTGAPAAGEQVTLPLQVSPQVRPRGVQPILVSEEGEGSAER